MLLLTKDKGLINLSSIIRVLPSGDGQSSVAMLSGGASVELAMAPDSLTDLAGIVVPANPDFHRLIYYFSGGGYEERHPIIAWRVYGHALPLPVTPAQEAIIYDDVFEAVVYPSGQIIGFDGMLYESHAKWLTAAKEARLGWMVGAGATPLEGQKND